MVTVVKQNTLGEKLGAGLGTGLSSGLDMLANYKFKEYADRQKLLMNQSKQAQDYQNAKSIGMDDQQARVWAFATPAERAAIIKTHGYPQGQGEQPMAPGQPVMQQEMIPQQQEQISQEQQLQGLLQGLGQSQDFNPILQQITKSQRMQLPDEQSVVAESQKPAISAEPKKKSLFGETKEQRKEKIEEERELKKMARENISNAVAEASAGRSQLEDLNRLQDLEKENKLDTAGYVEFLNRSGLDIPALMNEGSQEYNKIVNNFLKDARIYFGGRVSNQEMEQFLKIIPSLSQTPEGRKRVIANLKYLAQAKMSNLDSYEEILKENKGIPPYDIEIQVFKRTDKKLNKLRDLFKEELKKEVPAGQNRLVTASQAMLGDVLGSTGSALKGAAKGALKGAGLGATYGRLAGGTGMAAGATSGALLGGLSGLMGLI